MWSALLRKRKPTAPSTRKPQLRVHQAAGPPLTPEELSGNLSELERDLNRRMVCQAGKNQVYIRSLLTGNGTTQPRIALKCSLRRDVGESPDVFYEHIRDVCACDPEKCEAYRRFKDRFVET
ncbi:MAG: hypothetical protein D6744_11115 [Planctomycetota bacterium]|nr:MAG: hypothetical protein D6744_11115 [Planctomycetota bacterium]